jgi:Domain of unknown function (DUF4350)
MSAARSRELTLGAAGVATAVILAIASALLAPPAADRLPPGSSFSRGPSGSGAAYLTLESLGYEVRRSYEPLPSLTMTPESTVLVIADPAEPASNQDRRALQAFVAGGGTILVTGCQGATFLSSTSAGIGDPVPSPRIYKARFPSPLAAGAPAISMTSGCSLAELGPRYLPLYGDGPDEVVLFSRTGRGLAVWWSGNTPIQNRSIDAPGQLDLLLNVVGSRDRQIVWDEFYHGQRRSLWSYVARTPLPWGLAQIALAALVAGAMFVRRRLPIRDRFVEARTSPLEFVEMMASLYARAPSAAAAVALARTRLRRLLVEATGLSATATDARLAAAASPRMSIAPDDLRRVLEAADRAGSDPTTPAATALPLVQRLQAVAAALHGG